MERKKKSRAEGNNAAEGKRPRGRKKKPSAAEKIESEAKRVDEALKDSALDDVTKKKIQNLLTRFRRLLKESGGYRKHITYQVELTAAVLLVWRKVRDIILAPDFKVVFTENSREGDAREKVSAVLQLFIQLCDLLRRNLKALGMNMELTADDMGAENNDAVKEMLARMNEEDE